MKSFVRHHLLHLLLLLLSSCLLFSPAPAASQERAAILDSDGRPVFGGERYYVTALPDDYSLGTISPKGHCPPNVFLQTWRYGPPVMLFPEVHTGQLDNVVYVDESLSVMFASPSHCPDSTQWTLNLKTELVTLGGALSNSSDGFSLFRVVKSDIVTPAGHRYNFLSCPSPRLECQKLGVVGDEKLLGVSSKPLEVEFIRVTKKN